MFEWDQGSANRKFAHTRAHVKIEDKDPQWLPIEEIGHDGIVYVYGMGAIGETPFEVNSFIKNTKLKTVEFLYTPIECGFYHHLSKAGEFYCIVRKHVKSWKIGLSHEAYNIFHYPGGNGDTYKSPIDMERPFNESFMDFQYLGNGLIRDSFQLKYLETAIGFIDKDRIVLNDKHFGPLITPYLGDKWQIVNL